MLKIEHIKGYPTMGDNFLRVNQPSSCDKSLERIIHLCNIVKVTILGGHLLDPVKEINF